MQSKYEVYFGPNYGSTPEKEKKYKSCDILKSSMLLIDYYNILNVDEIEISQCRFRVLSNNVDDKNMIKVSVTINNNNFIIISFFYTTGKQISLLNYFN